MMMPKCKSATDRQRPRGDLTEGHDGDCVYTVKQFILQGYKPVQLSQRPHGSFGRRHMLCGAALGCSISTGCMKHTAQTILAGSDQMLHRKKRYI
jgi:hypothetical protein